jgi:hypothetical protein
MASVESHVERWLKAHLIDAEQARRILDFESKANRQGGQLGADRPGAPEALLYLGVTILAVGAVTLIAQNWDALPSWARIGALFAPAILLLAAGHTMRRTGQPAIARAATFAWMVSVALIAGGIGVVGNEAQWDGRVTALVAGVIATGLSVVLWMAQPSHPQVLAVAGSCVLLAVAIAIWPDRGNEVYAGLLIAGFGLTGIGVTERGLFGPRHTARFLSGAMVMLGLIGAAYTGTEDNRIWIELLVFVAGAGLIALSLNRAAFEYLITGIAGVFIGLVAFIFRHFEEEIGAPLALLMSGALLIGATLLINALRGRFRKPDPESLTG